MPMSAPVVLVCHILDRVSYNRFTPRIDELDLCRDMFILPNNDAC